MKTEAIRHNGVAPNLYLTKRQCLHIRLITAREDAKVCNLVYFTRTSPHDRRRCIMTCVYRDGQADYYEAEIQFPLTARYLKYYFEVEGKDGATVWLSSWGVQDGEPEDGFFEFLYANENDVIQVPEWAKGIVYYQIFPDRFCNGDRENDPPECAAWGSIPDRDHCMGGDLAGIRSKLPYLKELGVECLYLNPIFKADFNHRYATTDYFEVEPSFGTKEELIALVEECHEKGLRVILDGVFNHSGIHFFPFADLMKRQYESEYKNWFLVNQYPITISEKSYECVGAYPWMPKLNTSDSEVRNFIIKVMTYWLEEAGIDGWRLDVADEVDEALWLQARIELKERFSDCLLLGETWGSGEKLMLGNQMDSIMNYGFRDAVRDYLAKELIDARRFDERINHVMAAYPKGMQEALYNMLDSHDTERFLTQCKGDMGKMKLAVALQMLLPGSPAVYYGDEIGVEGENDPDCRRAFPWDINIEAQPLYQWYRELIILRKKEAAIRKGSFTTILCDGMIYAFCRSMGYEQVYVICNPKEDRDVCIPVTECGEYRVVFPQKLEDNFGESRNVLNAVAVGNKVLYNGDITAFGYEISLYMPKQSVFVIKKSNHKEETQ